MDEFACSEIQACVCRPCNWQRIPYHSRKWSKDVNGPFTDEDPWVVIHIKRRLISLIIKELRIRATLKCHFTAIEWAGLKTKQKKNKNLTGPPAAGSGAMGTLGWWQYYTWENGWATAIYVKCRYTNPVSGYYILQECVVSGTDSPLQYCF